jgi:serine/threonine protein kinase
LHTCGVLHRDLKTDNALISSKDPLVVKWADFGVSVKLDGKGVASTYGGDGAGNYLVSPAPLLHTSRVPCDHHLHRFMRLQAVSVPFRTAPEACDLPLSCEEAVVSFCRLFLVKQRIVCTQC